MPSEEDCVGASFSSAMLEAELTESLSSSQCFFSNRCGSLSLLLKEGRVQLERVHCSVAFAVLTFSLQSTFLEHSTRTNSMGGLDVQFGRSLSVLIKKTVVLGSGRVSSSACDLNREPILSFSRPINSPSPLGLGTR